MKPVVLIILGIGLLLGACSYLNPTPIIQYISVTATQVTPTPTPTPTPTLTPTPTAILIDVSGDARTPRIATPSPQTGAFCGIVDILDFPLKPPDAIGTRGGTDFGVFRDRYNGYHTGTDWGISGGPNFGESVYSIGHGVVTHADPNGWGADKGTIVIAHTFPDRSVIYSFYGHLDPPSVEVVPGQCVARGEKIGEIGRPRSSPHLHFEIRSIFPDQPVHGYLSYDPTIAGWKDPTKYIFDYRMATSPGVVWMRPSPDQFIQPIGLIDETTFLVEEGNQLLAINLSDGQTSWVADMPTSVADSALDFGRKLVYVISHSGELSAYSLQESDLTAGSIQNLTLTWAVDLEKIGAHELIPLPQGGVVVSASGELSGYSPTGVLLWIDDLGEVSWWAISDGAVFFSTDDQRPALWRISDSQRPHLFAEIPGQALSLDGEVLIYSQEGIYMLDPEDGLLRPVYPLTNAYPDLGSALKISDEQVLIAHEDRYDRRLILFDVEGNLLWERSYELVGNGQPYLLSLDSGPVLLTQKVSSRFETISLLSLDPASAEVRSIFEGGPVALYPTSAWAQVIDGERLLINLTGSWMVMLDAQEAVAAVSRNND